MILNLLDNRGTPLERQHLHVAMEHFRKLEKRDVEEILPATLPDPIPLESHREFVRKTLAGEVDLRADGPRFVDKSQEPQRSLDYRAQLNSQGSPTSDVAAGYRWSPGTELRRLAA